MLSAESQPHRSLSDFNRPQRWLQPPNNLLTVEWHPYPTETALVNRLLQLSNMPPSNHDWCRYTNNCQCQPPGHNSPQPLYSPYWSSNQWPNQAIHPQMPPSMPLGYNSSTYRTSSTIYQQEFQQPAMYSPRNTFGSRNYSHDDGNSTRSMRQSSFNGNHSSAKSEKDQLGPPRQPLQSRFALWVGGISSNTDILDLRDHFFLPESAADILSVVLMPRSNSGFINFRTVRSCKAAAYRFNNSTLNNQFLRCRCRRPGPESGHEFSEAQTSESNYAESESPHDQASSPERIHREPLSATYQDHASLSQTTDIAIDFDKLAISTEVGDRSQDREVDTSNESLPISKSSSDGSPASCRYFLIKSLTHDELFASVTSGRWATQSQNESALDDAYHSCDAVYLIFSVNRSGEFFGYARMTSPITREKMPQKLQSSDKRENLTFASTNEFETPARGIIPAGRVVDDLSRGKIFWEVFDPQSPILEYAGDSGSNQCLSSFSVNWISTRKLPFWQTKHLQNPWNSNKLVKVGRDGTEFETEVGRRLCNLFLSPSRKVIDRDSG